RTDQDPGVQGEMQPALDRSSAPFDRQLPVAGDPRRRGRRIGNGRLDRTGGRRRGARRQDENAGRERDPRRLPTRASHLLPVNEPDGSEISPGPKNSQRVDGRLLPWIELEGLLVTPDRGLSVSLLQAGLAKAVPGVGRPWIRGRVDPEDRDGLIQA